MSDSSRPTRKTLKQPKTSTQSRLLASTDAQTPDAAYAQQREAAEANCTRLGICIIPRCAEAPLPGRKYCAAHQERANGQTLAEKVKEQRAARIRQLAQIVEERRICEANGAEARHDENGNVIEDIATCGNCGESWNDALITSWTPAPSGRCPYEYIHPEIAELARLRRLQSQEEDSGEALLQVHRKTRKPLAAFASNTWTPVLAALVKVSAEVESWHSVHGHSEGSTQCDSLCALIPEMREAIRNARATPIVENPSVYDVDDLRRKLSRIGSDVTLTEEEERAEAEQQ